ncbi:MULTISPECIES: restriction endonuclease subunit S [unclassified Pseudoalteromonas]|uniref:restriction endonuclease subunit S n=1 Tax=unclassified Pseudoalteromonas TaxID=194690 RepID=UPI0003F8F974|nr:restriction endonuclease subunit S [Pseudoalteromonas sp. TB41]
MAESKTSTTIAEQLITEHLDIWTTAIEQKSSSGRGSSKKFSLHGIKKLRELILELAVRGKLVPQDPNDEPASVLLERIAAEKAQLIKDKKIKLPKALPEISEDEKPFEISEGWEWVRLGELGNTQTGGTPSKNKPELFGSDVPFIKPGDILEGKVCYKNEGLSLLGAKSLGRIAPANSLLMVCIGTIGKCSYIDRDCAFNQQINSITPYVNIIKYLHKVTSTAYFQNLAWELSSSTTIAIINKGRWESIPVALAPIAEQERIVAKVDELMDLCDALEAQTENSITAHQTLVEVLLEALLKAPEQTATPEQATAQFQQNWQRLSEHFDTLFTTTASIDTLKQTILQLAVMGKLVPQNPNDEPAAKLLERIAAEKAQLIKDKKIKKQKPLPEITDEEKPFELPENWEWCYLQDLFTVVTDGDHQAPPKANGGVPFLVIGNLNTGKIKFENCKFVPDSYYNKLDWTRQPVQGDLLYTVTGSYGIPIVVTGNKPFCVQRHVAILNSSSMTPIEYVKYVLSSKYSYEFATFVATGIAQKTVPLSGLRRMPIPVPPTSEAVHIVNKVNNLMALCDQLKARLTDAQNTKLHLTDAIVEQAL